MALWLEIDIGFYNVINKLRALFSINKFSWIFFPVIINNIKWTYPLPFAKHHPKFEIFVLHKDENFIAKPL